MAFECFDFWVSRCLDPTCSSIYHDSSLRLGKGLNMLFPMVLSLLVARRNNVGLKRPSRNDVINLEGLGCVTACEDQCYGGVRGLIN